MEIKTTISFRLIKIATIITLLVLGFSVFLTKESLAAFSLSVSPYEGGDDLRFGHIKSGAKVAKEVTVRITSDIGNQYRVIQTYLPLTNSKGQTIPTNSFSLYTLRGSSSSGTLGYDFESQVSMGPMTVYTSDTSGSNDSFQVVYGLDISPDQEPGLYRGRLIYSLEPIGSSSQNPVTKTLDVIVEVESSTTFEVKTATGSMSLKLQSSPEEKDRTQEVQIKINGFVGGQYRIVQKLSGTIRDTGGKLLPNDTILMSARGGSNGKLGISESASFLDNDVVLYTSDSRGSPDEIIITYSLNDKDLKAGIYQGSLSYMVESSTSLPTIPGGVLEILRLEVEVKPIFNLSVETDNAGRILFQDLKPGKPPQISTAYIEIQTNMDKPYQVVQRVPGLLTNEEGYAIPQGYFKLKTESEQTMEGLSLTSEVPVEIGQITLFSSKDGKPAKFKVIYKLEAPADVRSGNYSTGITYSLLEI